MHPLLERSHKKPTRKPKPRSLPWGLVQAHTGSCALAPVQTVGKGKKWPHAEERLGRHLRPETDIWFPQGGSRELLGRFCLAPCGFSQKAAGLWKASSLGSSLAPRLADTSARNSQQASA